MDSIGSIKNEVMAQLPKTDKIEDKSIETNTTDKFSTSGSEKKLDADKFKEASIKQAIQSSLSRQELQDAQSSDGALFGAKKDAPGVKRDSVLGIRQDRTNDILMGVGLVGLLASSLATAPAVVMGAAGVAVVAITAALLR